MLKTLQTRKTGVRVFLGVFIGLLGLGLLAYLVPSGPGAVAESRNTVVRVGDYDITVEDVLRQVRRVSGDRNLPRGLEAIYARQVLEGLVFERVIELEAQRLGIRVSDQERAERIKLLLPALFAGNTFAGMDRYTAEVQNRFNMTVPEFESILSSSLLEDKFRRLITDGITVSEEELQKEFRRRNERVKIEYVVLKPESLEAKLMPSPAELSAYFEKNKARYQLGERRSIRFVLLDTNLLSARVTPTDEDLRAYYNEHIERFRVQNRALVSHILFKTAGKTDAEIEEIRKKAEGVLRQARSGKKFEELAKQFSEDTANKDKGGDLGWIEPGQTVQEFEQAAFSLPKGSVSDLVKTQFGFHIIRVADRELARTKPLEEVRAEILPAVTAMKADQLANEQADKLASAVRQGSNRPIEEIAKQFGLPVQESQPVAAGDPILALGGKNAELEAYIFRLNKGQLSPPIRTERGYAVISLKEILPSRQATLDDVRDKVLSDYRKENAVVQAKERMEELARRAKAGEPLSKAAKAAGLETKTSEAISLTGTVNDVGSARNIQQAFTMNPGEISKPISLDPGWLVFRLVERFEAKPEDFASQRKELEQAVLTSKRGAAYEAFRKALEDRLAREGKIEYNEANLRRLTSPAGGL
jgi:peptidyl-prolyl cis-trans isomerase D